MPFHRHGPRTAFREPHGPDAYRGPDRHRGRLPRRRRHPPPRHRCSRPHDRGHDLGRRGHGHGYRLWLFRDWHLHDIVGTRDPGGDSATREALVPSCRGQAHRRGPFQLSQRRVAIVTDSTADLPPALAAARSISVVPLTLHFDVKPLLDGVDITPEEFYRKLPSASTHPTTPQPSPRPFPQTSPPLLEDHHTLFSIHIP